MKAERIFCASVLLAVFAVALYATRGSFAPGYIASWDGPAHVVRAEHFFESLNIESLGILGWYHGWYLGVAPFVFYTPGFFIFLAALNSASLGMLGADMLIKLTMALTYAAFPVALYWLSRTLGFSRMASVVAGIISLGFSAIWSIGLSGIYVIGLYTDAFSLLLFMLFWGFVHKASTGKTSAVPVGLLLGATITTNMISASFSFVLIAIYAAALFVYGKRRRMSKLLVAAAIGILVSLFWTYPFISSRELFGVETGFSPFSLPDLLKSLLQGTIIYNPVVVYFLAAGVAFLAVAARRKDGSSLSAIVLLAALFVTVLLSSDLPTRITQAWNSSGELAQLAARLLRSLLMTRSLSFFWIIVPIIGAFGIDSAVDSVVRPRRVVPHAVKVVMVSALLLFFSWQVLKTASADVKTVFDPAYAYSYGKFESAFIWLRTNVPRDSMLFIDINWDSFESPGTISIDSLANLEAGVRTVNGNQVEAAQLNSWNLNHMVFDSSAETEAELRRFGVDYVLSYNRPEYVSKYLEKLYVAKSITIYRAVGLGGLYNVSEVELGRNTYRATVDAGASGWAELPVQYNNHWSAVVDGASTDLHRSSYGLVDVYLKEGRNDIVLSFKRTSYETFTMALSAVTVASCLAVMTSAGKRTAEKLRKSAYKASALLSEWLHIPI